MFRRLFRWFLKTVVLVIVLFVTAAIVDYFTHRVQPGTVLVLDLKGPVVERGQTGLAGLLGPHQTALNVVRKALSRGARDPRIAGLAVEIFDTEMELAQAQEICAMIRDFASHGKWTAAYLETAGDFAPGNLPYLVASAAAQVSLMPQGELNLVGVGVREIFARGTLDWMGVKPDFYAIGEYKTAGNIFTKKDFTPAQREQDEALVASMFDQIAGQAASQRHLKTDALRSIIDRAPLTPEQGLKDHLIDRLEYQDQFIEEVKHRGKQFHPLLDYTDYEYPWRFPSLSHLPRVAVIYGTGAIERGRGGFDPLLSPDGAALGSDEMVKAFRQAREDDTIRAVIFRIDSPGGSVIGSELIRRAVELTVRKKPVVVSMSGYAASGGYWVATPANRIFAEPGTITGSIGVLGGKFNVTGMAQKLGVNSDEVSRGANVTMYDEFSDFTLAQEKIFQDQILGKTYQYFLKLVAEQRHMTVEQVDKLAQGRVWSGAQAVKIKLIDGLGGFDTALTAALKLAKLDPSQPVDLVGLPEQAGIIEKLIGGGINGTALLGPVTTRMVMPFIRMTSLMQRAALGQAYCPLIPVM